MESALQNENVAAEQARFMTKVYGWMCLALLATGYIAWWSFSSNFVTGYLLENIWLFYGLIIFEFIAVFFLAAAAQRISASLATLVFLLYASLNGLTFSILFLIYTSSSIALTFFVTAGTFGVMSAYGYFTKRDLTSVGNMATMGLMGIIIASIANIWLKSGTLDWIVTYVGILVFVALTAYDTQKIKEMNVIGNEGTDEDRKEAVIGALVLYLDFINLFLKLLRLFGRRR